MPTQMSNCPIQLSDRVTRIRPSPSMAANKRATELKSRGRDIADFTIGEPDLDTPGHVIEAAIAAMRSGNTHYTPSAGIAPLRTLIAEKISADTGLRYDADQVVVGTGAKQLIYEALMATLNPGDEVIVPAPYWVSYPDMVRLFDGVPVIVSCNQDSQFKLTADALAASITPRTRWVILNSPGNPSGAVYTRQDILALAQVLKAHPRLMVMTDDIYEALIYDDHKHVNVLDVAPFLSDRTLIVNGFSKSHAMTGWRIGYAAGPADLVNAISKLISQSTTCASSISQAAAMAALRGPQDFIQSARQVYTERRDVMHEMLNAIPGVECLLPQGAFYLFPCVQGLIGKRCPQGKIINTDRDLADYLLEAADVAVMDGRAYGLSPHLRLSYATSLETIEQGCLRIQQACAQLSTGN